MAAGTVVSRLSGFVRSALLVAALGNVLHADLFNIGNTVPNMLYILVAGGIFNAVLVPQLVRAMRNDADGGEAYTNRVVTAAVLFLALVTLLLVLAAPWVMSLYLDPSFDDPALAAQRESVIDFARYCLPQVFFYGMFVLVGQILNSRGRFGPMMWAPIANNVIAVVVLVVYLVVFGPATEAEQTAGFTSGQEALLGLGSTFGIVAQLLILLPFLRSAGFTFRPRFDLRDTGLGHTLRLGVWTVLFVVVNQIAYTVVVRLASGGTAAAVDGGTGTGYTVYAQSFLIVMVPHSVITVSLATAILPRLSDRANVGDLAGLARTLGMSLRSALAVVLPFALLLPVIAPDIAHVVWGWGAGRDEFELFAPTLSLFGIGLLFFTVHYLTLRGFYALERTRTVFWIQCVIATTNVAAAVVLVSLATRRGHLARAGARLHRVVRRRVGAVLPRPAAPARWAGDRAPGAVPGASAHRRGHLDRGGVPRDPGPRPARQRSEPGRRRSPGRGRHRPRRPRLRRGGATAAPARGHRRPGHGDAAAPLLSSRLNRPTMGAPSRGGEGVPNSIRPGDVLADRYLLVDLLSESGSGRFWRAHDRTLDRHVSVHVLAADDERAEGLMEAARRSAALHDRRILRVLDVDQRDDVCYVVNEWGSGRSIDVLVAHEGAVGGRRAAWIVSEVAESIAARARRGRRPRPARPGERHDRPDRVGPDHRAGGRGRPPRPPGRPDVHRRDRPGRAALLPADRQVARRLALRRTRRATRERPGAASAAGQGRRPAAPGQLVRPGAERAGGGR